MSNNNIAILGMFFGDESKAKFTHHFAKENPKDVVCIRPSGGSNAGHTIYENGKKIVRRLVPSANFRLGNKAFLGSSMVLNIDTLLQEIIKVEEHCPGSASNIYIDPDAFLVTAEHIAEDIEKNKHIGSTGKGISPAYRDKINRKGVRLKSILNTDPSVRKMMDMGVNFKHAAELYKMFDQSRLIFEGSQAILLDISFGTYPYVTSGETGLSGIINSGFARYMPSKVYGVSKAYSTRVGNGPYPTEILDEKLASQIREKGQEYGSVTKRPRRVGWLDLPATKYAADKAGVTDLILTKLDVLDELDNIPICTSYENGIPVCGSDFEHAIPNYKMVPGWYHANSKDMSRNYHLVKTIEYETKIKVSHLSCGVSEEDIIKC